MHSELILSLALTLTRMLHGTKLGGNNGIALRRAVRWLGTPLIDT